MDSFLIAVGSAFWLGVLTSISPCPLAGNIATISFLAKTVEKPSKVLLSGLLYIIGRILAYWALGFILVYSLLSIPRLSFILQNHVNQILGPILLIIGIILLDIFKFNIKGSGVFQKIGEKFGRMGVWGALPLGVLFALSFCPVSAALFFGSLIPLSVKFNSSFIMPAMYGIGTGLPVFAFALIISLGIFSIGKAYQKISAIEKWARRITGVIFIGVGLYFILIYIFKFNI